MKQIYAVCDHFLKINVVLEKISFRNRYQVHLALYDYLTIKKIICLHLKQVKYINKKTWDGYVTEIKF